ncbi:sok1 [Hyphodiscus hymeniophilus]|uniref:Sok1 n=1 Tax=Hyphodiscus hymeniophilus TaxID=353542 RepID=A0A9P6VR38_9HELO|nr:sok1 [Hyphodiscus hymeniophilus]
MEPDAKRGSRERGNSLDGHPKPPSANDGSLATSRVNEARSQTSIDVTVDSPEYGMGTSQLRVNHPPRTNYGPTPKPSQVNNTESKQSTVTFEPPVTKTTLSELDVNKIVHNPKLRHDINFDPDLHFRPNLDGEKGRKKKQKADDFWNTMRSQLQSYLLDREAFERELGDVEWCLPATLKAIRGILETLVPPKDRASVEEIFNVDLLMQQFRKGVADLIKLATWLSHLLKCHCAPMRDEWVDDMVTQLSNGDRNHDVGQLVDGILSLMAVLEAMKLDVANHQIRCLRPLLIEDTVHFEQKFFMKKIAMRRVDIAGAHAWFKQSSSLPDIGALDASVHLQGNTWDFTKALVTLTLPLRPPKTVPDTFLFDEERLAKLRADLLDLINLEVCMQMFRNLQQSSRSQEARFLAHDDTPVTSSTSSPYNGPASPADDNIFSSPTLPSEHHFGLKPSSHRTSQHGQFLGPSNQQSWVQNIENQIIASASTSPRSSPTSTASTPATNPPTPLYLSLPVSDLASQARSTFQAILASDTTSQRWTLLSSSLALQILRSTNTSLTQLPRFESHLAFHLTNTRSSFYQEAENRVLSQLYPALQKIVATYTTLTCLQIFESATAPKSAPGVKVSRSIDEITEIATRFAHIGILHWRVWAPLAYLVDPDADDKTPEMQVGSAP